METKLKHARVLWRLLWVGGAAVLMLVTFGCEAPLRLEQVEATQSNPIRRSDFFQVAASNGDAIVVTGNQGLVVVSDDGGERWVRHKLPQLPGLIDITVCPNGTFAALAFEGALWVSADDGQSWEQRPFESEEAMQAVVCDPANRFWIVGSFSTIVRTDDAGKTWTTVTEGEDAILTTIQFIDAQNAIVLGEFGTVLKTTDSGASWQLGEPVPNEFYPQEALFTDINTGWTIGLGGAVLYTNDGAQTWTHQATDTLVSLYGIERVGADYFIVGGEGVLMKLQGNQWRRLNHEKPIRLLLRAMLALDADRLLIAGRAGALHVLSTSKLAVLPARILAGSG